MILYHKPYALTALSSTEPLLLWGNLGLCVFPLNEQHGRNFPAQSPCHRQCSSSEQSFDWSKEIIHHLFFHYVPEIWFAGSKVRIWKMSLDFFFSVFILALGQLLRPHLRARTEAVPTFQPKVDITYYAGACIWKDRHFLKDFRNSTSSAFAWLLAHSL